MAIDPIHAPTIFIGNLARTAKLANWGLHLIDAKLAMGNLVEIVGEQAKAWMVNRR